MEFMHTFKQEKVTYNIIIHGYLKHSYKKQNLTSGFQTHEVKYAYNFLTLVAVRGVLNLHTGSRINQIIPFLAKKTVYHNYPTSIVH